MFSRPRRRALAAVVSVLVLVGMIPAFPAAAVDNPTSTVFVNEIHYDNTGTDAGETIEVAGPAGTDLSGWAIVLYNGSNGAAYDTDPLTGVIADEGAGYGTATIAYPSNGIQNGGPDGIALIDSSGAIVQFLSYEGVFSAADGAAAGATSTDIGVSQPSTTPVGDSLALTGTGTSYGDFTWSAGANSFGVLNPGQAIGDTPPDPTGTPVFVNEVHYDNAGSDAGEGIEVGGPAGTDLSGWSIVLYNGASGLVYDTDPLTGLIPDEGAGYGAVAVNYPPDGVQNGGPDAMALVDAGGNVVQYLSYEGTLTAVDGPAAGLTSTDIGVSESSSTVAGTSLQLTGPGTVYEDFSWTSATATFGCLNPGQTDIAGPTCGGPDPGPVETLISVIQGPGESSPLVGDQVIVEGVVVGDYEGPQPNLRGFYVQEEEADWDGDTSTSEGIFVFHGDEDTVALGDVVRVTGEVAEFQDQTQLGFPSAIEVLASDQDVPATTVELPFPTPGHLERYEGMSVTFPQDLYVTEFFQLGRFGEVVVSGGGKLQQPTAVAEPGAAANAVQAANDLNRIKIDDTTNDQNPDPIVFGRGGDPLTAENTLRGGDTLTGATGVLTYTWAGNSASGNAYRLRPDSPEAMFEFVAVNQRPETSPEVGGSSQVASFNVLNYFLTLDQGGNLCGEIPQECRGAESALEFERQRTKLTAALTRLDADVIGLMELENTPGVSPEADIAAALNAELGEGTYDFIDAGTVGSDVIRVGLVYKPGTVTPLGEPGEIDYGDGLSRTSLTQTFVENATGEVFSVVVNHLKSKGCADATGANADQGDGQGCWNAARVAAAQTMVAALPALGHGDDDWLIIGDLNSYDHEDPIDVLTGAGYVDLGLVYGGEEAYGYVFDGQWGYLDYALASPSLLSQVTGADEYHINSDEPGVLDYNTNFKTPAQIDSLYAPDEFRTSDHDPVKVGLALDGGLDERRRLQARPRFVVVPNHKYRNVQLNARGYEVHVVEVISSEADSGLGPRDVPDDIVIVDDDTLRLRAETFSEDGRVYTIEALVGDGGQMRLDTAEVKVLGFLAWLFNFSFQ